MSQFRFQDEKDWVEADSCAPDFLNLDPEEIASALDCIPMHERLNIEKEAFEVGHVIY